MSDIDWSALTEQLQRLRQVSELQADVGADPAPAIESLARHLADALAAVTALPPDADALAREPDDLHAIIAQSAGGSAFFQEEGRLWASFDEPAYVDRLGGALAARFAGCCLGAPVEQWPIADMQRIADAIGDAFPPQRYWSQAAKPYALHYGVSEQRRFTGPGMRGVPADDDLAYTLLGLLVLEHAGPTFTTADVADRWLKILPIACTAEEIALANLRAGVAPEHAAELGNPFLHWIGAAIRSDPWAWAAPAWPGKAAELAWRDARLSHRRAGVHSAMAFAAAQSAAFALDCPLQAVSVGVNAIPQHGCLADDLRWALDAAPTLRDHEHARAMIDQRFPGMHPVHARNNACAVVFALALGRSDVTRTLGAAVAIGLDNDCNAATAGSILGAIVGREAVPDHWTAPFADVIHTYLTGHTTFTITDVEARFLRQAQRVWNGSPA